MVIHGRGYLDCVISTCSYRVAAWRLPFRERGYQRSSCYVYGWITETQRACGHKMCYVWILGWVLWTLEKMADWSAA